MSLFFRSPCSVLYTLRRACRSLCTISPHQLQQLRCFTAPVTAFALFHSICHSLHRNLQPRNTIRRNLCAVRNCVVIEFDLRLSAGRAAREPASVGHAETKAVLRRNIPEAVNIINNLVDGESAKGFPAHLRSHGIHHAADALLPGLSLENDAFRAVRIISIFLIKRIEEITNGAFKPYKSDKVTDRYLGDCNYDGSVDVTDITMMVNFILNGNPTTTSGYKYDFTIYNTNKDASPDIDVSDVTALVNLILNGTLELTAPTELPIKPGVGSGTALSPKK